MQSGFYMEYLESLCRRRGWADPIYDAGYNNNGYTCHVLVHGRKYQTDLSYETLQLAQENAAMRAFMVCRNFSVNGGMLARNGVVQGLPAADISRNGIQNTPASAAASVGMGMGMVGAARTGAAAAGNGQGGRNMASPVAPMGYGVPSQPLPPHSRMGRSGSSSSSNASYEL